MPRPIHTNLPGYEAEWGIDLSEVELARLDAMAACRVDGRLPILPQTTPLDRVRTWGRRGLIALLVVAGLALTGESSEVRDPQPGESRAWMGERMREQVAREVGR